MGPPTSWKVDEVVEWLESQKITEVSITHFVENVITGADLLELTKSELVEDLELPENEAELVLKGIAELTKLEKARCTTIKPLNLTGSQSGATFLSSSQGSDLNLGSPGTPQQKINQAVEDWMGPELQAAKRTQISKAVDEWTSPRKSTAKDKKQSPRKVKEKRTSRLSLSISPRSKSRKSTGSQKKGSGQRSPRSKPHLPTSNSFEGPSLSDGSSSTSSSPRSTPSSNSSSPRNQDADKKYRSKAMSSGLPQQSRKSAGHIKDRIHNSTSRAIDLKKQPNLPQPGQSRPSGRERNFTMTNRKIIVAEVIENYLAKDSSELSLVKGQQVKIVGQDFKSGYVAGVCNSAMGSFPSAVVKILEEQEVLAPPVPQFGSPFADWKAIIKEKKKKRPSMFLGGSRIGLGSSEESALKQVMSKPAKMTREEFRQKVIDEILETERQYLKDLDIIVNVFIFPLRATGIMPEHDVNVVFSNIETLADLNNTFLKELEERLESSHHSPDCVIGDVFLHLADYFKMYKVFCSNQNKSLHTVQEYKKNTNFVKFLEISQTDASCRGLMLISFLIKPIQRICKYPLLLKELLKYTPENHEDHALLLQAKEKIEEVVNYVNEGQRAAERLEKMLAIQKNIQGMKNPELLISASRTYTRESDLNLLLKKKTIPCRAYLFSDLIVLCTLKDEAIVYYGEISLGDSKLVNHADITDDPTVVGHVNVFEILNGKQAYKLAASTIEEKNKWLKDIKAVIREFQKRALLQFSSHGTINGK